MTDSHRHTGLLLQLSKALEENPDAHAIVPGDPRNSQVFLRISSEDSTVRMPPAESNLSLSAGEIRLIKKWIEQGAKYEKHWAFVPPVKAAAETEPEAPEDLLLADFEGEDYGEWTVDGNAFGSAPARSFHHG